MVVVFQTFWFAYEIVEERCLYAVGESVEVFGSFVAFCQVLCVGNVLEIPWYIPTTKLRMLQRVEVICLLVVASLKVHCIHQIPIYPIGRSILHERFS